ncbi:MULTISPECIES: hypothetical protein [Cryobacterium]|nr:MULTISPECIES: hypothetical protein [Cryobacterium]
MMILVNRDEIEDDGRHPGWQFELHKPNRTHRAEIPAADIQRLERLWELVRHEERIPDTTGVEIDALIEYWGREGYSADQIAVATQLPLETVTELQKNPGVAALFNSRQR